MSTLRANAKALLELVEAVQPKQRIAHDQQGPPFAEDLQGAGDGAHLVVIGPAQHASSVARLGCLMLLSRDEVSHLVGFVDLDVVSGVFQQVQLAVGEQRGEPSADASVEVPVSRPRRSPAPAARIGAAAGCADGG